MTVDLQSKTLEELRTMRDEWALDAAELEAVNDAIAEAEAEIQPSKS